MKILILILASKNYKDILDTVRDTWYSTEVEGVETMFYFGNHHKNEIFNGDLYLTTSEAYGQMGPRTLNAFDYVKDMDFDYIFRVNAGAYIDKENVIKFLQDKPRENFYSGIEGNYKTIRYCSGAGYFLSKDLVHLLVENKSMMRLKFGNGELMVDDVAISDLLQRIQNFDTNYNFNIDTSASRLTIKNGVEIPEGKELDYVYHYRLRSADRLIDIRKMKKLHKELCKKNLTNKN